MSVKDCVKNGTLFYFVALISFLAQPKPKSHSSVFLCSWNQMEMLTTQASSSVVHYCDRKTSLHNRCYFLTFCRQVKTHSAKWARSVRHTQWGKVTMVCQQALFFCAFPIMGVSHSKSALCGLWLAQKTQRNNTCYAGCRKTVQL